MAYSKLLQVYVLKFYVDIGAYTQISKIETTLRLMCGAKDGFLVDNAMTNVWSFWKNLNLFL